MGGALEARLWDPLANESRDPVTAPVGDPEVVCEDLFFRTVNLQYQVDQTGTPEDRFDQMSPHKHWTAHWVLSAASLLWLDECLFEAVQCERVFLSA